jgi:quercetin dioxygenase-like cupin family protein
MQPGGHSTLERHEHVHAVMIFRGRGTCLVGGAVREVAAPDLICIPPMTWHQFRAAKGEPFGFLCMVNAARDKPQLPSEVELAQLKCDPAIAAFLDGDTSDPAA